MVYDWLLLRWRCFAVGVLQRIAFRLLLRLSVRNALRWVVSFLLWLGCRLLLLLLLLLWGIVVGVIAVGCVAADQSLLLTKGGGAKGCLPG